jgi:polar amino acid transport system substrate-binding protein
MEVLRSGDVDLGTFNASATLAREVRFDITFLPTLLYDGEAFLVRKSDIPASQSDHSATILTLPRRRIAAQSGATTAQNLRRFFQTHNAPYDLEEYPNAQAALEAYRAGECNVYALDRIPLSGERLRLEDRHEHVILKDIISKEAMGPVVRHGDPIWALAVTWIVRSLIEAEELGLNSSNVDAATTEEDAYLSRFLAPAAEICQALQVLTGFTGQVIRKIGNHAEIFERNLGSQSPLGLPRGQNALWNRGGLLFTPPVQ